MQQDELDAAVRELGRFNPLRGRQTLQPAGGLSLASGLRVSILYEADRLCNPLRRPPLAFRDTLVSILYEADRLCNLRRRLDRSGHIDVSILYEADRLCNVHLVQHPEASPNVSILYEADRLCNLSLGA